MNSKVQTTKDIIKENKYLNL